MKGREDDEETEKVPLIADLYSIKLRGTPGDLGEKPPQSWGEALRQINQHLIRLIAAPTRLITETLEGATRLVRGITRLPDAVAHRLEVAHEQADNSEGRRQQVVVGQLAPKDAPLALSAIESLLKKYQARGLLAEIHRRSDGRIVIVLGVSPAAEDTIRSRALEDALESGSDRKLLNDGKTE